MHKYTEEELLEETAAVEKMYEERLKAERRPLSGKELYESAIKKFNEIKENEL